MIPLSYSQTNILAGALQATDPADYLIAKTYALKDEIHASRLHTALREVSAEHPILLCTLTRGQVTARDQHSDESVGASVGNCAEDGPGNGAGAPASGYGLQRTLHPCDVIVDATNSEAPAPLAVQWFSGLTDVPLVRWTLSRQPVQEAQWPGTSPDNGMSETGILLTLEAHHLLLDGGAVSLLEESLARHLHQQKGASSRAQEEMTDEDLGTVRAAHRWEKKRCDDARSKNLATVKQLLGGLSAGAFGDTSGHAGDSLRLARRGIRVQQASLSGGDYRDFVDSLARQNLAIDSAVSAAAVAVVASKHHTTGVHVFHTIDPRFATPQLEVATCLVNTLWFPLQFPAFVSATRLIRRCDRALASARRRRWLREEDVRRELLRHHQTTAVSVTLNIQRGRVHENLRDFLQAEPAVAEIGPVETPTLVVIDDAARQRLDIELWTPAEEASGHSGGRGSTYPDFCTSMAQYLRASARNPHAPAAELVGDWHRVEGGATPVPNPQHWASLPGFDRQRLLEQRPGVQQWLSRLVDVTVPTGAVVVFEGSECDECIDLVLAAHLHGCGYSPCTSVEEMERRAATLLEDGEDVVRVEKCRSAKPLISVDSGRARKPRVSVEPEPSVPRGGNSTAYVLPTSGTTGTPKLVRITHTNLAAFLAGARECYGWSRDDVVAQCAELTSDISVEEIFLSALVGAQIVCLGPTVLRDPAELLEASSRNGVTVVDVPTSTWHALATERSLIERCRESGISTVVVGGEAINPTAVAAWTSVPGAVPVLSTYGPTEATVVATATWLHGEPRKRGCPDVETDQGKESAAVGRQADCRVPEDPRALGKPLVEGTVAVAFGEVVLLGESISSGYIGQPDDAFGVVLDTATGCAAENRAAGDSAEKARTEALATGDRVYWDKIAGTWLFAGRRDEVVKVAGRRVDLFALRQAIELMPRVKDCHVAVIEGRVIAWVQTGDSRVVRQVRSGTRAAGYPVSVVVRVNCIPRDSRGKVNREYLMECLDPVPRNDIRADGSNDCEQAIRLAQAWSRELHLSIGPDDSLIDLGVSSLDIMRVLPVTRALAGRNCGAREILQFPTARELTNQLLRTRRAELPSRESTHTELRATASSTGVSYDREPCAAVLLLGATGSVGSSVLRAWLNNPLGCLVVPLRGAVPAGEVWTAALASEHIEIISELGDWSDNRRSIPEIMDQYRVAMVLNCAGVTSTKAARAELDAGNVELPVWLAQLCKGRRAHLLHLSSTVVAERYESAQVTVPGQAHFDYAESKIAGELALAAEPHVTVVRLPRVVPTDKPAQLDALLTITAACRELASYPVTDVAEEVVTVNQVAHALLNDVRRVSNSSVSPAVQTAQRQGAELVIYRGRKVEYESFLPLVAPRRCDLQQWQDEVHAQAAWTLGSRVVDLIDEWVHLVDTFRRRPWNTVPCLELPYARVEQRDVGVSLTDADLIGLL